MKAKVLAIIGVVSILGTLTACNFVNTADAATNSVSTTVSLETLAENNSIITEEPVNKLVNTENVDNTLSDKYVDFDDMSILINGIKYTFNESTLQDMIDNGVPFVDISNANNNIKPNYESEYFEIQLDDTNVAYVAFSNFTDNNMTLCNCPLSSLTYSVVDNDVLTISCPNDLTPEMLIENSGDPTTATSSIAAELDENGETVPSDNTESIYNYTRLSSRYIGDHGYYFGFINNQLAYYTITYR